MNATPESLIKEYADPIEQQEIRPQDRPAACCGSSAAGVQRDGGLPLDVPVPCEGGLPHHARRGAP